MNPRAPLNPKAGKEIASHLPGRKSRVGGRETFARIFTGRFAFAVGRNFFKSARQQMCTGTRFFSPQTHTFLHCQISRKVVREKLGATALRATCGVRRGELRAGGRSAPSRGLCGSQNKSLPPPSGRTPRNTSGNTSVSLCMSSPTGPPDGGDPA